MNFDAQPGQRAQQREAAERRAPAGPRVEADGQQGGAGQRGARAQLRVHGAAVGQKGRAQTHRAGGAQRPRVGHHVAGQPIAQRHGQRRDRRQEQLDSDLASHEPGGHEQERKADPALGVLRVNVDVAIVDQRLDRHQVLTLVPRVVGVADGVETERGRVDAEQQKPQGEGAPHARRTLDRR